MLTRIHINAQLQKAVTYCTDLEREVRTLYFFLDILKLAYTSATPITSPYISKLDPFPLPLIKKQFIQISEFILIQGKKQKNWCNNLYHPIGAVIWLIIKKIHRLIKVLNTPFSQISQSKYNRKYASFHQGSCEAFCFQSHGKQDLLTVQHMSWASQAWHSVQPELHLTTWRAETLQCLLKQKKPSLCP